MPGDRFTRRRVLATAGTAIAGGIAGCVNMGASTEPEDPENAASPAEATATLAEDAGPYTRVYRETVGSVVLIRAFTDMGGGQGSGFVYRSQNYVVTNQHVVEGATELEVRYSRGEWRTAEVVGTDYYSDLAVLEVEDPPGYADPLPLVESEPPIGTEIVAIGNPFGLEKTMSAGIVSGTNRSIEVNTASQGGFSIPDAIQTDAALNPGNSGGPLLTLDGQVVGVVRSGGGENIGFGISAALTRRVATALIEDGTYEHSYMGVGLRTVSTTIAEANDLEDPRGVIVVEAFDGGPSDGVLQGSRAQEVDGVPVPVGGDVIVALDGTRVDTLNDLSTFLALQTSPGDTITVTVVRDGERQDVDLTLAGRPDPSG
jgi:S1-C subfamily serine protease